MTRRVHKRDLARNVVEFLTPVETVVPAEATVGEALELIRQREVRRKIIYFYAVDFDQTLIGVIPTRQLLISAPAVRISQIMDRPVISVPSTITLEEALEAFESHRLLALPVVDAAGRLLGTLDVDLYAEEALDLAESRRSNDLFQLIGLSLEETRMGTPWARFRLRVPWLIGNLVSGVACALIAAAFELVLVKTVLLAMFIPLVLTLAESISMQSMTLVLQHLHHRHFRGRRIRMRARAEGSTALLLGLFSGLAAGAVSGLWGQGWAPALVLGASVAASMTVSAMLGLGVPLALHALKLDPKVAAGPLTLMLGDILTTTIYLSLGAWWLT